jgi:SAM-dependent methyltransferase
MASEPRNLLRRAYNAMRRIRAGLSIGGENVSPESQDDLFVAHDSIYVFFSRFAPGQEVLDLGCGAGYGTVRLAKAGAHRVIGVDISPRNIAYARRHAQEPNLSFLVGDAEALPDLGPFNLIVSSNAFEHLNDVRRVVHWIRDHLAIDGQFLLAVPPVFDRTWRSKHEENTFHHSNLYVDEWRALLEEAFERVEGYLHLAPEGKDLDFENPFPSQAQAASFRFVPVLADEQSWRLTITAIFRCAAPIAKTE